MTIEQLVPEIVKSLREISKWPWEVSKGMIENKIRAFDDTPICSDETTGALIKQIPIDFSFIASSSLKRYITNISAIKLNQKIKIKPLVSRQKANKLKSWVFWLV